MVSTGLDVVSARGFRIVSLDPELLGNVELLPRPDPICQDLVSHVLDSELAGRLVQERTSALVRIESICDVLSHAVAGAIYGLPDIALATWIVDEPDAVYLTLPEKIL